eukprot:TRINITY_DN3825_c0_g1_i1.p1 TRINITY_DN3825_c0_g1~~TRINITY_DN3825_c0_g1_i1.p1  ORF type:complete len:984 (+),score=206.70 TRINITY_DN3825_c0_g1_i1:18-2969(+)
MRALSPRGEKEMASLVFWEKSILLQQYGGTASQYTLDKENLVLNKSGSTWKKFPLLSHHLCIDRSGPVHASEIKKWYPDPSKVIFVMLVKNTDRNDFKLLSFDISHYQTFKDSFQNAKTSLAKAKISNGYLQISVERVIRLTPLEKSPKPEPYFSVFLVNHKNQPSECYETVAKDQVCPKWDPQNFILELEEGSAAVRIVCYDNKAGKQGCFGYVSIPLNQIPMDYQFKRWFSLISEVGQTGSDILLSIFFSERKKHPRGFYFKQEPVDKNRPEITSKYIKDFYKIEGGQILVKLFYMGQIGSWHPRLMAKVIRGKDLLPMDITGLSDPYVKISIKSALLSGVPDEKLQVGEPHHHHHFSQIREKISTGISTGIATGMNISAGITTGITTTITSAINGINSLARPFNGVLEAFHTEVQKQTLNPVWTNNIFVLDVPPDPEATVKFTLMDWDVISNDRMGTCQYTIQNLKYKTKDKLWLPVTLNPRSIMMDTRPAEQMKQKGFVPKYPVFLIPGFASSALHIEATDTEGWKHERVWLNVDKLLASKASVVGKRISKVFSNTQIEKLVEEGKEEIDSKFSNIWVNHICLQKDCISDPPGIKVRAVSSQDGCTYLQTGQIGQHLAYVMGPLIKNLEKLGYVDEKTLFARPYDWRIPPHYLEIRDKYFTNLYQSISQLTTPIVLIGHSMGNRIIQYFLLFVEINFGRKWIDEHIYSWVAVGAPWLGAPKMLRALISGERMGLDALITQADSVSFSRRVGTTMFLLPVGEEHYWKNFRTVKLNAPAFVYVRSHEEKKDSVTDAGRKIYSPVEYHKTMNEVGAPEIYKMYKEYYLDNPCFGGGKPQGEEKILEPPPIKRLFNVYGVNMDTEKLYFYKKESPDNWLLDISCSVNIPDHILKDGIIYESKNTTQKSLQEAGQRNYQRSGDGTVTYESLTYAQQWKDHLEFKNVELPKVEHRDSISSRLFFDLLVPYICEQSSITTPRKKFY